MSPSASDQASERAKILEVGYRLLAESGGASVPVSDVLAAAGLSTRAFYRHFDSKDGLLLAMFRRDADRVLGQLQAAAGRAPTARAALEGWFSAMLQLAADPRRRQRALVLSSDEVRRAKGYRAEQARYQAAQDSALAQILHRGLDDGSFPRTHPEVDARFLRAVLHQAFQELMAQPSAYGVDESIRDLTDFALRAVGGAAPRPAVEESSTHSA